MAVTTTYSKNTLKVPGAKLYYEVRGSGPVLLMMPGGPADATTFRYIENDLAKKYTVVTYDPRTYSHSQCTEPVDDARMVDIFADDASRLLEQMAGDSKSCVFASSGGAVIALDLIVKHPEQVETAIIHEPPSPSLQPDVEKIRDAMVHVCETCERDGLFPAMQEFMVLVGVQGGPEQPSPGHEPTAEEKEQQALMMGNMQYFFGRYIANIARFEPDIDALKSSQVRIVPAIGAESNDGQLACVGGKYLAKHLDVPVTVFPGDHAGFAGRPVEFAAKLLEVLDGSRY